MKNPWLDRQDGDFRDFGKQLYKYKDEFVKLVPKTARVLDVGCGNGWFLNWLKELGYTNIEGIDVVQKAADETWRGGLGVKAALMDGHATDFEDSYFDAVSASHVLEHSPIPKALVRELVRITKGDGLLFLETPIQPEPVGTGGHFTFFDSTNEVDKLLQDEGIVLRFTQYGTPEFKDHYVVIGRVVKL